MMFSSAMRYWMVITTGLVRGSTGTAVSGGACGCENGCDGACGCDSGCENGCDAGACGCEEEEADDCGCTCYLFGPDEAWTLFGTHDCTGITAGGWAQIGYHTEGRNGDGTGLFNNYPNRLQAQQLWAYVEKAADQIERFSGQLRQKDVSELLSDAQRFARQRPAVFIGAAFTAGVLAARFLKSSNQGNGARHDWTATDKRNATMPRVVSQPEDLGSNPARSTWSTPDATGGM